MSNKLAAPRGTADVLEAVYFWQQIESQARRILNIYGYREIRTPIYEDSALFKRSLGSTSDVVNKQLLELAPQGDEQYALRPEGTAAVVRSYIENNLDKKESLSKLYYIGPMFRGERPQKGRLRQFHQIGVEAIGPNSASPYLDAELLRLAMHLLKEFGVKEPRLKINSLGSKEDKEHVSAWLRREFAAHKAELCPECQARFERNVFRVLDCKQESCRRLVASIVVNLPLSKESQDYFTEVQRSLTDLGVEFHIAPHLVRGLDYYTHTVFEITAGGLGSQDAIGAGGRYSGLVHELGGDAKVNFGAIGFALGMERVLLSKGNVDAVQPGVDAFVIPMEVAYFPKAFSLLDALRQAGISADLSYNGGSLKSQMNRANKANAKYALILGEDEIKNNAVALKDMQVGKQEIISLNDIVDAIKRSLTNAGSASS